jgi:DNA-binding MarR family transcriptional regulator
MLDEILFYSLDKAIRQYRKMAQAAIDQAGVAITIDQWLVLRVILEHDNLTQTDISERVFKDQASVARIIGLLVLRGLLATDASPTDGRRQCLRVTEAGQQTLTAVQPIVLQNRQQALQGLAAADLAQLRDSLERIYLNCSPLVQTSISTN